VIDVSLYESIFRLCDVIPLEYDTLGLVRERNGSDAHAVPHNHYPTGDGKWIAIACTNDRIFQRLNGAMGAAGWGDDPSVATMEQRMARRAEIDGRVSEWTASQDLTELRAVLDQAEVPNGPITSIADIFAEPHVQARGTLMDVDDPVIGRVKMPAPVPRLSETPARVPRPAPEVGEHNAEVYAELGLDALALDELRSDGVI
jgi:crotonobetainyl-CoA:carnitine CoA-transferase CaiB-like acyl-CoA transferase